MSDKHVTIHLNTDQSTLQKNAVPIVYIDFQPLRNSKSQIYFNRNLTESIWFIFWIHHLYYILIMLVILKFLPPAQLSFSASAQQTQMPKGYSIQISLAPATHIVPLCTALSTFHKGPISIVHYYIPVTAKEPDTI